MNINIQLLQGDKIVNEQSICISEGDTLVCSVPTNMNIRERSYLMDTIEHVLRGGKDILMLPDTVKLSVIKVGGQ